MYLKPCTTAHEVRLASNDREHLVAVAELVGAKYGLRKVAVTANTYVVSFCSKEMFRDLEALGASPHKSRTIGFPAVPTPLLPHFVRGVIDGDGTLSWNASRPIVQIYSGSPSFLKALAVVVERGTGIPAPRLSSNRSNWYIKWSTMRAKCLAGWLYFDNPGLMLARKSAIATQFIEWQPKKRPEKGMITDKMRSRFVKYLPSV